MIPIKTLKVTNDDRASPEIIGFVSTNRFVWYCRIIADDSNQFNLFARRSSYQAASTGQFQPKHQPPPKTLTRDEVVWNIKAALFKARAYSGCLARDTGACYPLSALAQHHCFLAGRWQPHGSSEFPITWSSVGLGRLPLDYRALMMLRTCLLISKAEFLKTGILKFVGVDH